MTINKLENYYIKENKIYRKKFLCNKTFKLYYEKELKIQKIKNYEYVYINGKLHNLDKIKNPLEIKDFFMYFK